MRKLLERFKLWLTRDIIEALDASNKTHYENDLELLQQNLELLRQIKGRHTEVMGAFDRMSAHQQLTADVAIKLAHACESLETALTDRMDIIEGRLDEMKPEQSKASFAAAVGGHKRWTQRRDDRVSRHFNVSEFTANLQKAGKDG